MTPPFSLLTDGGSDEIKRWNICLGRDGSFLNQLFFIWKSVLSFNCIDQTEMLV